MINNKQYLIIFLTYFGFLMLVNTSISADNCGNDFEKGVEQFRNKNYESAIQIFEPISKSRNFTDECNSRALIYIGICKYFLGNKNQANAEFIEAIKLFPDTRLPDENLPQDLTNLFGDTQKRILCDVEIYVQSPFETALNVKNQIKLIHRMKNVLVGKISVLPSKYNEYEIEYQLISGKLNKFYLQIERVRDYHAYDSLVLSFYPHEDFPEMKKFEELEDGSFIVKSGSQRISLERDHYQGPILTNLQIRNEGHGVVIPVLEVTSRFNRLLRDLHFNSTRKRLNQAIKKVSVAGFVVSTVWSIYTHTTLSSAYDDYLIKVEPDDMNDAYRKYLTKVHRRNYLAGFAAVFALTRIIAEKTEPRDEEKILNRYNRQRNGDLSLLIEPDLIGLKYTIPL